MIMLAAGAATASARTAQGGAADDKIIGSTTSDRLYGGGGDDRISGGFGTDRLVGETGADTLTGGPGDDRLLGGAGADRLNGGAGADALFGGAGDDRLTGGAGSDSLFGGEGDDHLVARDGEADAVTCGPGDDTVVADAEDQVAADCEHVSPQPAGLTRGVPYPSGGAWPTADGWRLEVLDVTPDATSAVLHESEANSSPQPGDVYTVVRVRATRTAARAAEFDGSIRLRAMGPTSALIYSSFEDSCGLTPDPIPDDAVASGDSVEGNVCWSVPEEVAPDLVMVDSPLTEDEQRFFALR
jgi:hypothetical protein